jgi:hypothetical protein
VFEEWVEEARAALGLEDDVDVDMILGIARDVAHEVERRAAPVTTFLIGLAAGRAGGGANAEETAAASVRTLLESRASRP